MEVVCWRCSHRALPGTPGAVPTAKFCPQCGAPRSGPSATASRTPIPTRASGVEELDSSERARTRSVPKTRELRETDIEELSKGTPNRRRLVAVTQPVIAPFVGEAIGTVRPPARREASIAPPKAPPRGRGLMFAAAGLLAVGVGLLGGGSVALWKRGQSAPPVAQANSPAPVIVPSETAQPAPAAIAAPPAPAPVVVEAPTRPRARPAVERTPEPVVLQAAPPAPAEDYETLVREGNALRAAGRHREARPLLERALALRPQGTTARYALGLVALETGAPAAASRHFEIAAQDGYVDAYLGLGRAERAQGHRRAALHAFDAYLERMPNGAGADEAREQRVNLRNLLGER